jgi:hypothetical protein
MKISLRIKALLPVAIALSMLRVISSCVDDDKVQPAAVQFTSGLQNIAEGSEATITVTFSKPPLQDGSVRITVGGTAVHDKHFTTEPLLAAGLIDIPVAKGSESVSFKVFSIPNTVFEGDKNIIFELLKVNLSDGLQPGLVTVHALTILDDEGPSKANFEVNAGTLAEANADGIEIHIPLSAPAQGTGAVTVSFASAKAVYNTHFITQQEGTVSGNSISLPVIEGATGLKFNVLPVDNDLFTDNQTISFTISSVSGVVEKGNTLNYVLTLLDDELPSVANFAVASGTVDENNADGIVVNLPFSSPVKGEGKVIVRFTPGSAVYGTHFTTSPPVQGNNQMIFNPAHNAEGISFTVFPVDNSIFAGDLLVPFTLWQADGVLRKGNNLTYDLTIVEDEESPPFVNFLVNESVVDEDNAAGINVELSINPPPKANGAIAVTYTGSSDYGYATVEYGQDFLFDREPLGNLIILQVAENQTSVTFKVFPNYLQACENRFLQFSISGVNGGLARGTAMNHRLLIKDADASEVKFAESEGTIGENSATGKVVQLDFSKPVSSESELFLYPSDNGAGYTGRYTTNPLMEWYYDWSWYYYYRLPLKVQQNAAGTQFIVKPVNNSAKSGNYTVAFEIRGHNGCVQGAPGAKYILTIVDDD